MVNVIQIIFIVVTVIMVIAILMQSSKSDGLGAGFGAMGGTQVFSDPGNSLRKFTTIVAIIYGALVIWLSILYRTDAGQIDDNPLLNNSGQTQQSAPAADQSGNTANPVLQDSTKN